METTYTQVHSLETLRKALTAEPQNIKTIFGEISKNITQVKEAMPKWLKNIGKLMAVIFEQHAKLAKKKALGLDATMSRVDYTAKWLGGKPNRRMVALAMVADGKIIPEDVYDTRELYMLTTLSKIHGYIPLGDASVKQAFAAAKAAVIANDRKALNSVVERLVQKDEDRWTFLSEAEAQAHAKQVASEEAVTSTHHLSAEQLLAAANAEVVTMKNIDEKSAAAIETHVRMILEKLQARPASKGSLESLKPALNNTVAA